MSGQKSVDAYVHGDGKANVLSAEGVSNETVGLN